MKLFIILILNLVLIISCSQKEQNLNISNQKILLKKIVENFDDDSIAETEIYNYEYKRPTDVYWIKETLTDETGEIQSITTRKLDNKSGLPIEEYVEELGEITETYKVIYSSNTGQLLLRDEYEGKFNHFKKIKSTKCTYVNGIPTYRTVITYSPNDKFVNADKGNYYKIHKLKFFPGVNTVPPGNFEPDFFFVFRKEFEDNPDSANYGKVLFEEKTEFNDRGYPVYHYTTQPGCAHEGFKEWYEYKLDNKGHIISLKSFDNLLKTELSQHSSLISYSYDKHGFIHKILESKFSPDENAYTKFHDLRIFGWLFDSKSNCQDFNFINEHYCLTGHSHSIYKKLVSFPKPSQKVVSELYDSYVGNYKSRELNPKLFKKTTYIYR